MYSTADLGGRQVVNEYKRPLKLYRYRLTHRRVVSKGSPVDLQNCLHQAPKPEGTATRTLGRHVVAISSVRAASAGRVAKLPPDRHRVTGTCFSTSTLLNERLPSK